MEKKIQKRSVIELQKNREREREREGANKSEGGERRRRDAPQGGRTPAIYWILEISDHLYTRRKVRSVKFETRYFGRFSVLVGKEERGKTKKR